MKDESFKTGACIGATSERVFSVVVPPEQFDDDYEYFFNTEHHMF